MPNIVRANCVPIGDVDFGVDGRSFTEFVVDCLFFCRSRLDEIIDFMRRVDALPFKSLKLSINLYETTSISSCFDNVHRTLTEQSCVST
jgi:hypothetical protein